VAELIDWFELELRIVLLPPISRAAHLGGPAIHARRLVQIWRDSEMTAGEISEASDDELIARRTILAAGGEAEAIDATLNARKRLKPIELANPVLAEMTVDADHWGDDDVPLSQAFRLLGVEAVARAIFRTVMLSDNDYPNDPIHWPLPPLNDLLPELHAAAWEALLDGRLQVEALRYAQGTMSKIAHLVSPIELERLRPDWELSRLCRGDLDEFVRARVRRAPGEPAKPERPSKAELKAAMLAIAETYPPDAHPHRRRRSVPHPCVYRRADGDCGRASDGPLLHAELRGAVVDRQRRRLAHLLYRPHQHRPRRFRAGRRLCLGDPRFDLWPLVLAQLAARRAVLRGGQRPRRSADPQIARRLFRHGDAGADRSGASLAASVSSPHPHGLPISPFGRTARKIMSATKMAR
jgi:hypothetical protein